MRKKTKKSIPYYNIGEDKIIYPATTSKRVLAKVIDFLLIFLPSWIIISISFGSMPQITQVIRDGITAANWSTEILTYLPDPTLTYIAAGITIGLGVFVLLIFPLIIMPLINKDRMGQSIGKLALSITPLYLSSRPRGVDFIIKEIPFLIIVLAPSILRAVTGIDASAFYSVFRNLTFDVQGFTQIGIFDFFDSQIGQIEGYPVDLSQVGGLSFAQVSSIYIIWITLILTWISVAISPQKKGIFDLAANTSVVDLKKISTTEEAKLQERNLQTILDGKIPPPTPTGPNYADNPPPPPQTPPQTYPDPSHEKKRGRRNQRQQEPDPVPYVKPLSEKEHEEIEKAKEEARKLKESKENKENKDN